MGRHFAPASILALLLPAAALALPAGKSWTPTAKLQVSGFDYLASCVLDVDVAGLPYLSAEAVHLGGQDDVLGFSWADSLWRRTWHLGRTANLLWPVPSPPSTHYLIWNNGGALLLFTQVLGESSTVTDTVGVMNSSGISDYAAAASATQRWAAAVDNFKLRLFTAPIGGRWLEVASGGLGASEVGCIALDDSSALVVWSTDDGGMKWGKLIGKSWQPNPDRIDGYTNRPRLRVRPSGGRWLARGTYSDVIRLSTFQDDLWSSPTTVTGVYSIPSGAVTTYDPDLSRDGAEYPIVAWDYLNQFTGSTTVCAAISTDSGFAVGEELAGSADGFLPSVARDSNGDAWVAWWGYYQGLSWTHTYTKATTNTPTVTGNADLRQVTWTLSEPCPGSWWAIQRSVGSGGYSVVGRARAGASTTMSWSDSSLGGNTLHYRIRRESVDARYIWLSPDAQWDPSVGVEVALLSAEAMDRMVRLKGYAPALAAVQLERRTAEVRWSALAALTTDGTGAVAFDDHSVQAGNRYGYRLRSASAISDELWAEVPRPALSLEGLRPNPSSQSLLVAFTLPSAGDVDISLFDLHGRRALRCRLAGLSPGPHVTDLPGIVAPGLYLLTVTQNRQSATKRAVVLR